MPQLIAAPTQIPVPGNKIIDEYIGRVNSGDTQASIAHMRSPAAAGPNPVSVRTSTNTRWSSKA